MFTFMVYFIMILTADSCCVLGIYSQ